MVLFLIVLSCHLEFELKLPDQEVDQRGLGERLCIKTPVGCWRGCLSGARYRFAYGPADATDTHCLLLQKIQIDSTFLLLAHPGSPGQNPSGP